ncbi:hypothetical protein RHSIM_Rhsim01G0068000 [Rhododendron simsii]|uniref:Uncharacterized protein n=1 Tax=Rhododendron simsii TaxID=118357 RepID=A0A834HSM2_RHOSS|nr:hypothetical protein RHSIM_Rhsim01G0068000 [Rhododendron simsii]
MAQATPSSSGLYGDGERRGGGGGKFRNPAARRPPPTPYDRPPSSRSHASGDGGWLSKLVDPAYRLIAGGASRILPSIFSKSPFSAASSTEDHDSEGSEVEETAYGGSEGHTVNVRGLLVLDEGIGSRENVCMLEMLELVVGVGKMLLEISKPGGINSKEGAELGNGSSDCVQLGRDKINNLPDGTEFSKIEQLVKGRKFSRDELDRLTGILNSRVGDLSNTDSEEKTKIIAIKREGKEVVLVHENRRMSVEEKQDGWVGARVGTSTPLLPLAAKEPVGASPVDIARAYMRTRVSEVGTASRGIISDEETSLQQSGGFASPLMPSHSPKSSVCWPGSMVQDQHGYSTPQSSRYGLHHFQRTPYSRTMYSKSKPELTRSQTDKKRYLNILSTPRLQPQTTLFGKDSLACVGMSCVWEKIASIIFSCDQCLTYELIVVLPLLVMCKDDAINDVNASVGPIRRARRKFVSEARPRSGSLRFPQNSPLQVGNSSLSNLFLPAHTSGNLEVGSTSTHTEFQSVDNTRNTSEVGIPALQSSNPAVRAILEHLDRNKPTPKEKSAELQLATEWKKFSSSKVTDAIVKEGTPLPHLEGYDFPKNKNFVEKGSSAQENDRENSNFKVKPAEKSTSQAADRSKDIGTSSTLNRSNGPQIKFTNETFRLLRKVLLATLKSDVATIKVSVSTLVSDVNEMKALVQRLMVALLGEACGADDVVEETSKLDADHTTSFKLKDSIEQKGKNQLWPLHSQSERRGISNTVPNFVGSELLKKPPVHSSASKPNLASISVSKPSFGFTFPVSTSSGVLPEPPTPSIMPSTLASSPPQPKDGPAIPSYSFGTKRSKPPLVFSFPSTSNASVQDNDTADIKFSFGSDGKNRVSFRSVDAICY